MGFDDGDDSSLQSFPRMCCSIGLLSRYVISFYIDGLLGRGLGQDIASNSIDRGDKTE